MDIRRPPQKRLPTRGFVIGILIVLAVVATVAVAQLRPAAPAVSRAAVMTDVVRRGALVRSVRGSGRLVPQESRWTAAATNARVEKILVEPGSRVRADTILIELSDPRQQQEALDAQWQLRAAEAVHESLRASLKVERLNQEASHAALQAEYESARMRADSDAQMAKEGIVADLTRKMSSTNSEALQRRLALDKHRLRVTDTSLQSRLAVQKAEVEQRRALYALMRSQVETLRVRAGIAGVLQEVAVEVGQRVAAGATLARVVQPERLKAEVQIAETRARDVAVGQPATIDTYNGKVAGVVSRIDPAAREGTVTIDIRTTAPLPDGTRPDLTIEATVELGRIDDALHVGRPVGSSENATGTVFKLINGGRRAQRIRVAFGQSSADSIQVTQGLAAGDEILVSDTAAWDKHDTIELH